MRNFREIGYSSLLIFSSVRIFFTFFGHSVTSIFQFLRRQLKIDWSQLTHTIFLSGARLMLPIIIISSILGFSLSLTLFSVFNELHLGKKALPIAQMAVITNFAPLLIGIILSIQSALNLINANVHKLPHTADKIMRDYIIPIMLGIIITGLLLYIYCLFAFLVSIYLTFQYALNVDVHDHLSHLASSISLYSLDYSVFKAMIYCMIIALVVGYYYYKIALRRISLRKAVSRIMTRSLSCIILFGAYANIFLV